METKHLIRAIAADAGGRGRSLKADLALACAAAVLVAALVFLLIAGPRSDFTAAAATIRFQLKFVIAAMLAGAALVQLSTLSRPGARLGLRVALLAIAPAVLAVAVLVELAVVPSADWTARWIGSNSLICLTFIPVIGLGPLAIFLAVLRFAAPTRPELAGAVAGLLAGSLAALFYAAHCFDDSPLFVATWYSIAIATLMLAGAAAGRRVLRW